MFFFAGGHQFLLLICLRALLTTGFYNLQQAVNVANSHCPSDISGIIVRTANITGILSTRAEIMATAMFAFVGPHC